MKLPIKVPYPPVLFSSGEKKWAVCQNVWVEVPTSTTRENVGEFLLFEAILSPIRAKMDRGRFQDQRAIFIK